MHSSKVRRSAPSIPHWRLDPSPHRHSGLKPYIEHGISDQQMKISLLAFLRCGSPAVNKSSRTNPYWFGSKSYHKTPLYESNPVSYWTGRDGNKKLAFRHVKPCKLGGDNDSDVGRSNTTVLFLNGLLSNMNGTKCNALQIRCI